MLLLGLGTPAAQGIHDQRVVHVHKDSDGRIDGGDGFDGQHRVEEAAVRAFQGFGDLDAHEAELEELWDEMRSELLLVVHATHERLDLFPGKLLHRRVEERFLLGELGERGRMMNFGQAESASGLAVYQSGCSGRCGRFTAATFSLGPEEQRKRADAAKDICPDGIDRRLVDR